jgi:hypothetical protein
MGLTHNVIYVPQGNQSISRWLAFSNTWHNLAPLSQPRTVRRSIAMQDEVSLTWAVTECFFAAEIGLVDRILTRIHR